VQETFSVIRNCRMYIDYYRIYYPYTHKIISRSNDYNPHSNSHNRNTMVWNRLNLVVGD